MALLKTITILFLGKAFCVYYSKYTTALLQLFEATCSSCTVTPCISAFAIMLRKLLFFRDVLKMIIGIVT